MSKADARGADFSTAELSGAVMSWAKFDRASFRSAELMGAVLTGSSFDGADFRDAELNHAIIGGVDLSRARGLDQDQLDEACADTRTKVPPGLTARACSARMLVHIPPPPAPSPPIPGARYMVAQAGE